MKKSTIRLLAVVMALTFGILLYFQVSYMENIVRMREEQFSENVMRALYGVSHHLEQQETLYYLDHDGGYLDDAAIEENVEGEDLKLNGSILPREDFAYGQQTSDRYRRMRDALKYRYRYQQSLLNEVIISIIQESANRPAEQRVDSAMVRKFIYSELKNRGMNVPFSFALMSEDGTMLHYSTPDFDSSLSVDFQAGNKVYGLYSIQLFPNSDVKYTLLVDFPTEKKYIYRSVRFIIPTLAFTVILLVIFLYTIIVAFRQKKLSEMKNDFINNMTHEFKTPISTISLAAQMLDDKSVNKSPNMISHCARVINDESKRLRVLVEQVLVLSMFDNAQLRINIAEVDANKIINSVVGNFKIKVEKFGGGIEARINATNAVVAVDAMHFTNVIYSLLDNAVKYRKEDEVPQLRVETRNIDGSNDLQLKIVDNGIGIRQQDQRKIFERFYRVNTGNRRDVKGYGIGLAYVHEVVKQFGGTISVESEYGHGTTFVITLPSVSCAVADVEDRRENEA